MSQIFFEIIHDTVMREPSARELVDKAEPLVEAKCLKAHGVDVGEGASASSPIIESIFH